MKIISVIPLKKGVAKSDLSYFTSLPVEPGHIVSVPIRKQKMLALVTEAKSVTESKQGVKEMGFGLRKAEEDKGKSIFSRVFRESVAETAEYFAVTRNAAYGALIPKIFLENYDKLSKVNTPTAATPSSNLKPEKLLLQSNLAERVSTYKTLIRETFARGKSVFVALPTEQDIEKWREELARGIEQFAFTFHSSQGGAKSLKSYEKIFSTNHPLLIFGTAPYLSLPYSNLGLIILEHESAGAWRTIARPYLDLRTFVEVFAARSGAKLIFGDDMLRFETLGRREEDGFQPFHPLSYRLPFYGKIKIFAREKTEGKFQILDEECLQEIKSALREKKNVFIFSLRKGLATETVCRNCGETKICPDCGSPLVLYLSHKGKQRMFVCNRCQKEVPGDTLCSHCGSWDLSPYGIGTDTVTAELREKLPGVKMFKLDKESARTEKGAREIIKEFESTKGAVLVGTEMSFFYLHYKVALSIIASFDSLWSIPSFRIGEKITGIIISLAGLSETAFYINTRNSKDAVLQAVKSGNLLDFIRSELEDRRKLDYPPYKRFIKISVLADKDNTLKYRQFLSEVFKDHAPEIFSGFVGRKNKYVTNALIKISPKNWSLPELSPSSRIDLALEAKILSLPLFFDVRVDPEDLL